jgi:hypothetical protein
MLACVTWASMIMIKYGKYYKHEYKAEMAVWIMIPFACSPTNTVSVNEILILHITDDWTVNSKVLEHK